MVLYADNTNNNTRYFLALLTGGNDWDVAYMVKRRGHFSFYFLFSFLFLPFRSRHLDTWEQTRIYHVPGYRRRSKN